MLKGVVDCGRTASNSHLNPKDDIRRVKRPKGEDSRRAKAH